MARNVFSRLAFALVVASTPLFAGADSCPGYWRPEPGGVSGLDSSGVADLLLLPSGDLVVGSPSKGLTFYERQPEGFFFWRSVTSSRGGLASNSVTSLAYFQGDLWVGTATSGIGVFDFDTQSWSVINTANSALPSNTIRHLTAVGPDPTIASPTEQDHVLWASTPQGAAVYSFLNGPFPVWTWNVYDTSDGIPNDVYDVGVQFDNGKRYTWFATKTALLRREGTTLVDFSGNCALDGAERVLVEGPDAVWFSGLKLVPDVNGGVVRSGLCRYGKGPRLGVPIWTHFEDRYGYDMSVDRFRRLWTSGIDDTPFDGVDSEGSWAHDQGTWCIFKEANPGTIHGDQIAAVLGTGEKTWFGHHDAPWVDFYSKHWSQIGNIAMGLFEGIGPVAFSPSEVFLLPGLTVVGGWGGFSSSKDNPEVWTYHPLNFSAFKHRVNAFLVEDNRLWVGTSHNGLLEWTIHPVTKALTDTGTDYSNSGLGSADVRAFALDSTQRLWVGTSGGLSLRANGYFLNFSTQNSPIVGNDVSSLAVDGTGALWIGTHDGGISVLDAGLSTWSSQTTAQGLASNDVRSLALAPDGTLWAATAGGACARDPATGAWTVHNTASGALTNNDARSIAVDTTGRVWVGTTHGLARREGNLWRVDHPSTAVLNSDVISNLTTRGEELWVSCGDSVSVRKDVFGPIGEVPPQINSVTPNPVKPGFGVVINGQNFDERGPAFNQVFFGIEDVNGLASKPAEILSATADQIIARVPLEAADGKLRVVSHCLEDESATELKIAPSITSFEPQCAILGTLVTIHGAGLTVGGACEVRFGNGPWRKPLQTPGGGIYPTSVVIRLQPGDEPGKVQVRRQDGVGSPAVSSQEIQLGTLTSGALKVFQGVEMPDFFPLIWGKRTIFNLQLKTTGCAAVVTEGELFWKKTDGTFVPGGRAYVSPKVPQLALELTGPTTVNAGLFDSLDFIAEFDSARSKWTPYFSRSKLTGIRLVVRNGPQDVLTVDLDADDFPWLELERRFEILALGVTATPGSGITPTPPDVFWADAMTNFAAAARIVPQPDVSPFGGPSGWISLFNQFHFVDHELDLDGTDILFQSSDLVQLDVVAHSVWDPSEGQLPLVLIDPVLYGTSTISGFGPPLWTGLGPTFFAFNSPGDGGWVIAHEFSHKLGAVSPLAYNHTDLFHSYYDECDDEGEEPCPLDPELTYSQAMRDYVGTSVFDIRTITEGAPFKRSPIRIASTRPKSVMAYVAGRSNENGFLEPRDFLEVFETMVDFNAQGGAGGGGANSPVALRLVGSIDAQDQATTTLSYLDTSGGPTTPPVPQSDLFVVVKNAQGTELARLPFAGGFTVEGQPGQGTTFALRIPFPEGASQVELWHATKKLLTRTRSANPPQVSVVAPAGGRVRADTATEITWAASDPDGGDLQFALDYSADGGTTWTKLPQYLKGNAFSWRPGFLPASASARLRIRASDGFNTSTALSALFALSPEKPLVFLRHPVEGQEIHEGTRVDLVAQAMAAGGINPGGSYEWTIDGEPLRTQEREGEFRFLRAGPAVVGVTYTDASRQTSTAQVTVKIIADYDHDGLSNEDEQLHGLNPLDPFDAAADTDKDGLNTLSELFHESDPLVADTDGDGVDDGTEIALVTSPIEPTDKPLTAPKLYVGPTELHFVATEGGPPTEPTEFFVLNQGPGQLSWSAQANVPWLEVTPTNGNAPTEVSIRSLPSGLAAGEYTGEIVFTAARVAGSPDTVTVHLSVQSGVVDPPPPPTNRFLRGDANADGAVDLSDGISVLSFLFTGGGTPVCLDAADASDQGEVDISSAIYLLAHLFTGGAAPPSAYPQCGEDPSADRLAKCVYPEGRCGR